MTIRYTKDHEWVRLEDDIAVVGVSDYAQGQLGDVVYVELPQIGTSFRQGDEMAVVESVKAASEVYAPVSGEVIALNSDLESAPGNVNSHPEGAGWFLKLRIANPAEIDALMTPQDYQAFVETLV